MPECCASVVWKGDMELNTETNRLAPPRTARPEPRDPRADSRAEQLPSALPPGEWPAERSVPVSVLVPVKNEEANLVGCLRRLRWAGQVVVVDSQSTDGTVPLAQALDAEVYQFYYSAEGWPKKKNWALAEVDWRHEWVLIMDADEHMTPELAREIAAAIGGRGPAAEGYWLNRRFMFTGRWIRHCGYYPSWNLRLFKHARGRYERIGNLGRTGSGDNEVHEHVVLAGGAEATYLKNDFLHYAYPDLATWVEKHNRYSTWEAHAMRAGDSGAVRASLLGGPIARRRWLKAKTRRLPFRPFLRFVYAYVFQLGFLDGYAGYCLCVLLAWYEFISLAKLHEMRQPRPDGNSGGGTDR
jgi:glycosyltransferase involved in cell wall biosynthesis